MLNCLMAIAWQAEFPFPDFQIYYFPVPISKMKHYLESGTRCDTHRNLIFINSFCSSLGYYCVTGSILLNVEILQDAGNLTRIAIKNGCRIVRNHVVAAFVAFLHYAPHRSFKHKSYFTVLCCVIIKVRCVPHLL